VRAVGIRRPGPGRIACRQRLRLAVRCDRVLGRAAAFRKITSADLPQRRVGHRARSTARHFAHSAKITIAWHEASHALGALSRTHCDPVKKVSRQETHKPFRRQQQRPVAVAARGPCPSAARRAAPARSARSPRNRTGRHRDVGVHTVGAAGSSGPPYCRHTR
jgi:hypothetical protein